MGQGRWDGWAGLRAVAVRAMATKPGWRYALRMARPLQTLTSEALALDAADRLRLATELIDSVEGPADPTWAGRWATELRRRSAAADDRELHGAARGADWTEVKERLLSGLRRGG
jgi:hypothetical protein